MALDKLSAFIGQIPRFNTAKNSVDFAKILEQKKEAYKVDNNFPLVINNNESTINKIYDNIVSNHESSVALVKDAMSKIENSPQKLIELQFSAGVKFLSTQLFCKTIETSANTVKNFTQMQV
jgi:hypothetical protein